MNRYQNQASPEEMAAKAFSQKITEWAGDLQIENKKILENAAFRVCLAFFEGNVCLLPDDFIDGKTKVGDIGPILLDSGTAASEDDPGNAPLVLDNEGRLYIHRNFANELRLAEKLANLSNSKSVGPDDEERIRKQLDSLFPTGSGTELDWQKIAAALALKSRLLVISGGPGTGKTWTAALILAALLNENPDMRIELAAPTGKAAARLQETIKAHKDRFKGAKVPEARTIHRLLGISADGRPRYHEKNRLPLDTLVLDEASMLGSELAARLFDALPDDANVIFLGDKDQLSAVEAGAVFAELSRSPGFSENCLDSISRLTGTKRENLPAPAKTDVLLNNTVHLEKNYRFQDTPGICELTEKIRRGIADKNQLFTGEDSTVRWIDMPGGIDAGIEKFLLEKFRPYFGAVKDFSSGPAAGIHEKLVSLFEKFNAFRVLCAVREGPAGINEINLRIGKALFSEVTGARLNSYSVLPEWFAGKPVMIRRNDYRLNLFNGDVGIMLPDRDHPGRFYVWFEENGAYRKIPAARLLSLETSFAMTVHQSQGSEFPSVAIFLPNAESRILCRELIYTGITRARREIIVAGSAAALEKGLKNVSERRSGLRYQLGRFSSGRKQANEIILKVQGKNI